MVLSYEIEDVPIRQPEPVLSQEHVLGFRQFPFMCEHRFSGVQLHSSAQLIPNRPSEQTKTDERRGGIGKRQLTESCIFLLDFLVALNIDALSQGWEKSGCRN